MHPALTAGACEALRTTIIELDPRTPEATIRELLALRIITERMPAPDGTRRYGFTTLGARWQLHLLIQEEDARPCRCGEPYSKHDVRSPHASLEGDCRSFTAARPLYATSPSQEPAPARKGAA